MLSDDPAAGEDFMLSPPRRLALLAVLGVALLMLISPVVLAISFGHGEGDIYRAFAPMEHISFLAVLVQLGRLPLALVQAILLARSPTDQ